MTGKILQERRPRPPRRAPATEVMVLPPGAAPGATIRADRSARQIGGLYAVTPDMADTAQLLAKLGAALDGGCRLVQYRNKAASAALRLEQAAAIRSLTRRFGARLIINDHLSLALQVGADGVHLGRDDADHQGICEARIAARDHAGFMIGVSCYNQLPLAERAAQAGADYIAFGSMFTSGTKPQAVAAAPSLLSLAKSRFNLPIVAIGGISPQNARIVIESGADAVAVISSLFDAGTLPQIRAQSRLFTSYFSCHV